MGAASRHSLAAGFDCRLHSPADFPPTRDSPMISALLPFRIFDFGMRFAARFRAKTRSTIRRQSVEPITPTAPERDKMATLMLPLTTADFISAMRHCRAFMLILPPRSPAWRQASGCRAGVGAGCSRLATFSFIGLSFSARRAASNSSGHYKYRRLHTGRYHGRGMPRLGGRLPFPVSLRRPAASPAALAAMSDSF